MNAKISVIVPIYKVEDYLPQCIESIINQTYNNLEIILVDDGSPDKCPQICDEYAKKDNRIRVIHKENGGLSSARNAGLDIATGDYIAFVDSDDYLDVLMYQTLMGVIDEYGVDVVVCDLFEINGEKLKTYSTDTQKVCVLDNMNDIFSHFIKPIPKIRFEVWNKLFKRSAIGDVRFKVGQIYEDLHFDRNIFMKSLKVAHIDIPGYYYRCNRLGSTNSFFKDNRFIYFEEMEHYFALFGKWKDDQLTKIYAMNGMETCLAFYISAIKLNATANQKRRIVDQYRIYWSRFSSILDNIPLKFKIFNYSPYCYYIVSRVNGYLKLN